MTDQNLPSVEYLRKRLRYEPETGKLYWRPRDDENRDFNHWNVRYADKVAGTIHPYGYVKILLRVDGQRYDFAAHRVIWLLIHGEWPTADIDHKNGDRADNRLENLRSVVRAVNMKNVGRRSDNTSGVCGVYLRKKDGKWRARLGVNGRDIYLGAFISFDDAVAARKAAAREHGFTERHGT
jgi:hypothetical protein